MNKPTVLIIGALTEIGRAAAIAFAQAGNNIVISGRNEEKGELLVKELKNLKIEADYLFADVRHEEDVRNLVDWTNIRFGSLDVAVNIAEIEGESGLIVDQSVERGEFPKARIIMLTMIEGDVEIQRALKAGASAYILKNMSSKDLIKTIRTVYANKKYIPSEIAMRLAEHLGFKELTPREIEVLKLVADGSRNQDIAQKLFIAEETVKMHVMSVMQKLDANSRTQAVSIALRRGIIQL